MRQPSQQFLHPVLGNDVRNVAGCGNRLGGTIERLHEFAAQAL